MTNSLAEAKTQKRDISCSSHKEDGDMVVLGGDINHG